jgi:hypothetical protein
MALSADMGSRAMVCPESPSGPLSGYHRGDAEHEGERHDGSNGPDAGLTVGPTCNVLESSTPAGSTYVPDVAGASAADRAKAQRLLNGVNDFCNSSSAAEIESTWRPGLTDPTPTHFFNPEPKARGLDPANPRAALIYDDEIAGVMFAGKPLPPLGSIPRAHTHDPSSPLEMVHLYCTTNLKEAFTPSRTLGVKADTIRLRVSLRPALLDLDERQLRALLAKVRGYAGDELAPVAPVEGDEDGRPDPRLQAMRIEIRASLMLLTESQLRSVRTSMRSS